MSTASRPAGERFLGYGAMKLLACSGVPKWLPISERLVSNDSKPVGVLWYTTFGVPSGFVTDEPENQR